MAKRRFPPVIHITREEPGHDEPYYLVHPNGVMNLDEPQPVAIYKLVSVGRVEIRKRFVQTKKP